DDDIALPNDGSLPSDDEPPPPPSDDLDLSLPPDAIPHGDREKIETEAKTKNTSLPDTILNVFKNTNREGEVERSVPSNNAVVDAFKDCTVASKQLSTTPPLDISSPNVPQLTSSTNGKGNGKRKGGSQSNGFR
ncbi:MAG: hypothetical protein LBU15_04565, partial [Rickettsiales bacterium]|nr:hypothetical protein [Rickettsiales bacterium]